METELMHTELMHTELMHTELMHIDEVHRVVAAMLVRDGSILLCHRTPTREWLPDVWDLAGGHIESGESPAQALVRECFEELGVAIAEPGDAIDHWHDDLLDLTVFRVVDWRGQVSNAAPHEHDRLAWFTPEATVGLELADERYRRLFAAESQPPGASPSADTMM